MNARQIAQAIVSANEQSAATQGGLNCDDQVEAVDYHFLVMNFLSGHAMPSATLAAFVRTRSAGDSQPLARCESVAIAYELER